jgi:hypothetical protein
MPPPHSISMDDIISLHCEIATLKTELRLEREKRIDSQNGNLCLVNLIGQTHKLVIETNQDQEIQALRCQLDDLQQSNAQLKRMLATAQWTKDAIEASEGLQEVALSPAVEEEDVVGDLLGSISGEEEHDEMSKIQDEADCSVSEEGVHDGWAKLRSGTDKENVNPSKGPVIKRVRFLDHEHNRLAGTACFIDDLKDPVEYEEYWIEYASKHPDHTAEEWREYYEAQIRPSRCETGTAQPVHMHSYSMDEVKQYDISTVVQPVDSPLQHSKWSSPQPISSSPQPISRWPKPSPRPPTRQPHAGTPYLSYEVTHFPASKDPSLRRTVLVSNIPIGMTLTDLFSELPSDRILEAKFAGTAGMKTLPPIMMNMAIVEFLDNEDAQMYVDEYAKHEVFDVKVIASPTRPLRRARVDSGYN